MLAASANMDVLVSLGTSAAFLLSLYNWLGDTGGALYFEAAAWSSPWSHWQMA